MKAIVLSRVSTVKQDLVQQTNELLKEVKMNGYDDENIIIIENKESGISNDEEHLNGINQMKEMIQSDNTINAVYVYEVSRLSRRPTVLYSIRDFLLSHNIQLVILKPYLRLIDIDGKMSQSASIMFSLFSSISESEMMIKKERMMRGKHQKMAQGKYSGGHVSYGYTVEPSTKQIVVNEETARIVRKIYDMYTESEHSVRTLTKELMATGDLWHTEFENALGFVKLTLKSPQYTGGTSPKGLKYPPIITEQQFKKSREKSIAARKGEKTKLQYQALGKKLIRYKGTGRMMTTCLTRYRRINDKDVRFNYTIASIRHQKSWCVNGEAVDSILWYCAKRYYKQHDMGNRDVEAERIRQECIVLRKKFQQCYTNINKLVEKHKRIENRILNGKLNEAKGDVMLDEIAHEIDNLKMMAGEYEYTRVKRHNDMISIAQNVYDIDGDVPFEDKLNIVKQTIKSVEIESLEKYGCSALCIFYIDGTSTNVEIHKTNRYLKVFENGEQISL